MFELEDRRSNDPEYEGKVKSGNDVYEFEIDATTGRITEWELERSRVQVTTPAETRVTEPSTNRNDVQADSSRQGQYTRISHLEARTMVTDRFGGVIQKSEYNYDGMNPLYKGEAFRQGEKLVFEINARTGEFHKYDVSNDNGYNEFSHALGRMISMNEASASVIARSGNKDSFIHKIELNWDDSNPYYQGEAYHYDVKHSFELYAFTGEYGKFESDRGDDKFAEEFANVAPDHMFGGTVTTTKPATTQAPVTQAPTTQAPTTQAPVTQAPTTQAPTTQAPTTQAPTTQAPTTQAPTTQAPVTQAPTTQAPTTTARQYIGADRAKAIALAKVPGATLDHIRDFEFDNDRDRDDRPEYEGEIKYNGYEYEFEIDAYTGEITEWEVERDGRQTTTTQAPVTQVPTTQAPVTQAPTTKAPTTTARQFIGTDRAKAIALAKVPGATVDHIHDFELDRDDRPEYEGEIKYNGYEYEFEIDAYTGQITEWEVDGDGPRTQAPTQKTRISRDEAIRIALTKVSGATAAHVDDVEFDDDEVEVEIEYNGKEYEIEIDAYSGKILDVEIDD